VTHDEANVWVGDVTGDTSLRRLTFSGRNRFPIWSADGQRVAFQSNRDGDRGIFWQPADGSGPAERLTSAPEGMAHAPESWSPDGKHLLFSVTKGSTISLWTLSLPGKSSEPFGGVESTLEPNATFSPDGRWVVFMTREADKFLMSVQPFPATGAKYLGEGGIYPIWSREGHELYYFHGQGQFSAVEVLERHGFSVGAPADLWTQPGTKMFMTGLTPRRGVDPTPDGSFVSLISTSRGPLVPDARLQVVLNWREALKHP
jgi:Tol biopolymer transport system component